MVMKFADGFDSYSGTAGPLLRGYVYNTENSTRIAINTTGGRNGGGALELKDATANQIDLRPYASAPSSGNTFCFGFWIKSDTKPASNTYFCCVAREALGDTIQVPGAALNGGCHFGLNSAGFMTVGDFSANSATLTDPLAWSNTSLCDGEWHWVEIAVVNSSTTGLCSVYIDGVQEIDISGDFKNGSGTSETDKIVFGNATTLQGSLLIDDLIIYDDDTSSAGLDYAGDFPIGPVEIEQIVPNAAGSNSDWTSSGGTNYTVVDEAVTNGDFDYVESTGSAQTDTYAFGNLTRTPSSIKSVAVSVTARNNTGASASYKAVALSGESTTEGATVTPGTTYSVSQTEFINDPDTATAWTESGINAAEFGVDSQ